MIMQNFPKIESHKVIKWLIVVFNSHYEIIKKDDFNIQDNEILYVLLSHLFRLILGAFVVISAILLKEDK